ncbi:MAG: glucose-1-phosphate thymidylyltransferase [Candidatus Thermoplasmatota archaeon]
MKGLILAGGHGTRLRPLTHTGPKQLIPIANKPNILYCLEDIRNAGITEIGVILGNNMPEKVIGLLEDGSKFGVKIEYIKQGEPKGIAHAIGCAEKFIGDDGFVVYLGDNILKGGITNMVNDFMKGEYTASVVLCKVKEPQRFGVVELDEKGKIKRLVEKPKEFVSDLALAGIYFFRKEIFGVIKELKPSWRNELEITEAIDKIVKLGKNVNYYIVTGWWKDTGKPEDILEANNLILDELIPYNYGKIMENVELIGRVGIGKGTVINEGCSIRGPALIGENCKIGPRTYIGPYTSIGDNSEIVGCEIQGSIVIGETKILCKRRIIDSLIGKSVEITESKVVPEGYRLIIGENSKIMI